MLDTPLAVPVNAELPVVGNVQPTGKVPDANVYVNSPSVSTSSVKSSPKSYENVPPSDKASIVRVPPVVVGLALDTRFHFVPLEI